LIEDQPDVLDLLNKYAIYCQLLLIYSSLTQTLGNTYECSICISKKNFNKFVTVHNDDVSTEEDEIMCKLYLNIKIEELDKIRDCVPFNELVKLTLEFIIEGNYSTGQNVPVTKYQLKLNIT